MYMYMYMYVVLYKVSSFSGAAPGGLPVICPRRTEMEVRVRVRICNTVLSMRRQRKRCASLAQALGLVAPLLDRPSWGWELWRCVFVLSVITPLMLSLLSTKVNWQINRRQR
jgi:hypothetical protein